MIETHGIEKTHGLRATGAEVRLRAIRAQLSAGFTLCQLMEAAVGLSRTDEVRKLSGKVRRTVESVRRHLDEPHHVPEASLAEARDQLAQLETRVLGIEARLKP